MQTFLVFSVLITAAAITGCRSSAKTDSTLADDSGLSARLSNIEIGTAELVESATDLSNNTSAEETSEQLKGSYSLLADDDDSSDVEFEIPIVHDSDLNSEEDFSNLLTTMESTLNSAQLAFNTDFRRRGWAATEYAATQTWRAFQSAGCYAKWRIKLPPAQV